MITKINAPSAIEPFTGKDWAGVTLPIAIRLPAAVISAGADACEACFWAIRLADWQVLDDWVWHIELNSQGELELTPFAGPPHDTQQMKVMFALFSWNKDSGNPGLLTGPKRTSYRLSNGAVRRASAAWTAKENVRSSQSHYIGAFLSSPDFIVEIRSDLQRISVLQAKMQEYMENGAKLGWLIDPIERTVRVYRAGADEPELLQNPETLDGEDILPGFTFAVRELIFELV